MRKPGEGEGGWREREREKGGGGGGRGGGMIELVPLDNDSSHLRIESVID